MSRLRQPFRWWAIFLALVAVLTLGTPARAAKYSVAQCGWHLANDADWADSTGGEKFRPDAYCATPPGADPFDGVHMKSLTRESVATVSGTRFARWRWVAPAGTGIVNVRGTWWQAVHDGLQHRLGTGDGSGGFDVFAAAEATDTAPRAFVAGFDRPRPAFESRLLCARPEDRHCSVAPPSFSSVRALTLTVEDLSAPSASAGSELSGAWQRGTVSLPFSDADRGSGVRFSQTQVDGARVALSEHHCAKAHIGGEWRAVQMRPCAPSVTATHSIDTRSLADGPHWLRHCAEDFAGAVACAPAGPLLVDNTPPAAPQALSVVGEDGWRAVNDFDLAWQNPDQGPGSPIAAAGYRLLGPGYDSGPRQVARQGIASLANLQVPGPGEYLLRVWLRDQAGNENEASAAEAMLLFDDVAPGAAFLSPPRGDPELARALVRDEHSGPGGGRIDYRRAGSEVWKRLPTELRRVGSGEGERYELVARFPSRRLGPGAYELRAEARDRAGNAARTTRRADGSPMVLRAPLLRRTELVARFAGRGGATRRRAAFGGRVRMTGTLRRADGAGLAGRTVRLTVTPAEGSLRDPWSRALRTGRGGRFAVRLGAGTSREIRLRFAGQGPLAPAASAPLRLGVRAGVVLAVSPHRAGNGERVTFTGRVRHLGARVPARGKLVQLQYLDAAVRRWRPALIARSGRAGRFRRSYRFSSTSRPALIRFRAAAPPEAGWPYAFGASRPVAVRVSG